MKPLADHQLKPTALTRRCAGMTLVETMFAMVLMGMVIGALLSANFYGLRQSRLMESKAGANDTARRSINQLLYDIRSAKSYDIGTMAGTNFTAITNGAFQGAGLKLYLLTIATNQVVDPNRYRLYFFDSSQTGNNNGLLWQLDSTSGTPTIVVSNLINTLFFTSEDYIGNTQTVRTAKGVVHATLQFSQFQYPLTPLGSNGLFDYYRIECRATPHIPDGS